MSTKMSINYGNEIYWEERYKKTPGEHFDWLCSFEQIKSIITTYIPSTESSILYIGCGTSDLGEHLCKHGYTNVTCIDKSKQAIKQQKQKITKFQNKQGNEQKHVPKYLCGDAMTMTQFLKNQLYDVVIDKCMLDSILCSDDYLRKTLKTLRQVSRVLNENGVYIMFSHQGPTKRIYYLKNKLTKFKSIEFFPITKFNILKRGNDNKIIYEAMDDSKSVMTKASRISKSQGEKLKRNSYCYICTRVSGDIEQARYEQQESQNNQQIDQQQQENQKNQQQNQQQNVEQEENNETESKQQKQQQNNAEEEGQQRVPQDQNQQFQQEPNQEYQNNQDTNQNNEQIHDNEDDENQNKQQNNQQNKQPTDQQNYQENYDQQFQQQN